jgi:hypothetical protein
MRALCCKEQPELLNAYLEANHNAMRHLGPLLKSVSLRGNPKESVKHKSNNNGCGSSKNARIHYYISPFSGEFAKASGEGSMRMPHFSCNMCCSSTYQQTASTDSGWRS